MRKGCSGAIAGVILLAGGAWAWSYLRAPRLSGVPFKQLPRAEQQKRRVEAKQLESQVQDIQSAARAHQKKPFTLEISDEQVNTLLQDRIDLSKFPIRNLVMGFEPGRVVAQGDASYNGFQVGAALEGSVALADGALSFETSSLQIGGVPAPGKWKEKLDSQVTEQLNRALKRAPGRIDDVRLEQGKMIVSGQTD